ncbi:prolactin-8A9-like [Acomys russatus]|uniref:prolactin-8A9-like n=1 Tax=Acomys russatus TaxID=60746 RepID=UPI0021E3318E|nr:prolactin-8A9-like [Acomys russatus]
MVGVLISTSANTRTLLLLVISILLLCKKAASIPACRTENGGCRESILETINNALTQAGTMSHLAHKMYDDIDDPLMRRDQAVFAARTSCHSKITNPPDSGAEHTNLKTKKYLKMLINFVGAWSSPLSDLMIELSAMQEVPESIVSEAKEMEKKNREILDDLRWILTKAYPTATMIERFPSWHYLPALKSNDIHSKCLAMYNLCNCLNTDTAYTIYHLRKLKCRLTGEDC